MIDQGPSWGTCDGLRHVFLTPAATLKCHLRSLSPAAKHTFQVEQASQPSDNLFLAKTVSKLYASIL
jgi:hypothetical protein